MRIKENSGSGETDRFFIGVKLGKAVPCDVKEGLIEEASAKRLRREGG